MESKSTMKTFFCRICHKPFSQCWYYMRHVKLHRKDKTIRSKTCKKISECIHSRLGCISRSYLLRKSFKCSVCKRVVAERNKRRAAPKITGFSESGNLKTERNRRKTKKRTGNFLKNRKNLVKSCDEDSQLSSLTEDDNSVQTSTTIVTIVNPTKREEQVDTGNDIFAIENQQSLLPIVSTMKMSSHSDTKQYKCSMCGKTFSNQSSIKVHMLTHTGEKPFRCSECEKCFTTRNQVNIHMRIHTKERPYTCEICDKAFTQLGQLKRHLSSHTGEKPFPCEVCRKTFARKFYLTKHMRTHTKERPFKCMVCERAFAQSVHLKTHMKVHTGERPFECEICKKSFARKGDLTTHLRIHTKEKPFACTNCGKAFTDRSTLVKHLRLHSGENGVGLKTCKCGICQKPFSTLGALKTHMVLHTGEKPFLCEDCGKKFPRKGDLRSHVKVHKKHCRHIVEIRENPQPFYVEIEISE